MLGWDFLVSFLYVCWSLSISSSFFSYSVVDCTTVLFPLSAPIINKSLIAFLSSPSAFLSSLEMLDLGGFADFNHDEGLFNSL